MQLLTSRRVFLWIVTISAAWLLWALIARGIIDNPWGTVAHGIIWRLGLLYVRRVHRLDVLAHADLLRDPPPGPLIIVANHTAGIDPMLIQARCSRPIRWIMAEDMREPRLAWVWSLFGIIFVDRDMGRAQGLREAIAYLRHGGIVGIFPEGGLERPAERLRPFQAGVGVLVQRSGAPVLPIVIRGTPDVSPAWASLWRASRSSIEVGVIQRFEATKPRAIADELERVFRDMTGWDLAPSASPDAPTKRRDAARP